MQPEPLLSADQNKEQRWVGGICIRRHRIRCLLAPIINGGELHLARAVTGKFQVSSDLYTDLHRAVGLLIRWGERAGPLAGIGVSCYGPFESLWLGDRPPLGEHEDGETGYGRLTDRGLGAFGGVNLHQEVCRSWVDNDYSPIPVSVHVDANASALGEYVWLSRFRQFDRSRAFGGTDARDRIVSLMIDDGIGVGVAENFGVPASRQHAEMGHWRLPVTLTTTIESDPLFKRPLPEQKCIHLEEVVGCYYHGRECFEGVLSLKAIEERSEKTISELVEDRLHPDWILIVSYIEELANMATLAFAPNMVVIDSPLARNPELAENANTLFQSRLAQTGLLSYAELEREDGFIQSRKNPSAGALGAAQLALKDAIDFNWGDLLQ